MLSAPRYSCSHLLACFLFQKRTLALHAPTIASQGAIVAYHPMTGNGHREPIGRTGLRHCPHCPGRADADLFEFTIASSCILVTAVNLPMPQAHRTPGLAFKFDN